MERERPSWTHQQSPRRGRMVKFPWGHEVRVTVQQHAPPQRPSPQPPLQPLQPWTHDSWAPAPQLLTPGLWRRGEEAEDEARASYTDFTPISVLLTSGSFWVSRRGVCLWGQGWERVNLAGKTLQFNDSTDLKYVNCSYRCPVLLDLVYHLKTSELLTTFPTLDLTE